MIRYATYILLFLTVAFPLRGLLHAQTENANLVETRRQRLERELGALETQIEAQRSLLQGKQRERVSLERDVAIIDTKIEKARLSVLARNIGIEKLSDGISDKEGIIGGLSAKIDRERESLAQLIRKTNEIDGFSLAEVVLSNENFSEFFADIDAFASIKSAINESFELIEGAKNATAAEKAVLEDKRGEEMELRTIQQLEKQRIEEEERQKQRILKESRGVEAVYQKVLKDQEKTAAAIRAELFSLQGSAAIPFGRAFELAALAGKAMNVRPAFILAIIAEESNLGENVGTGNWRTDMHPDRDQPVFADITARLGLAPDTLPVSKKPWYGWGGAMGPAQFIPSTWVLYEQKIANFTGHNPPNPWDPGDAFVASAILLAENGADRGGAANERLAALRYLAGWKNAEKPAYAFYGDDVMQLAEKYQAQIDILNGV